MRLDGGVLVKGAQSVIVNSVMGDTCIPFIPTEKSSSEEDLIRMCPLTSSIISSTESNSIAACSYPRRILLSFLRSRKRLTGEGNMPQLSNQNSHNQIAMISQRNISKAFSQKETSDLRRERGAIQSESEFFGEMCNHCVSSDQIPIPTTSQSDLPLKSSKICTCCCSPQNDISSYPSSSSSSFSSCHQINSRFNSSSLSHSNLSYAAGTHKNHHHFLKENANKLCHHINNSNTKQAGSKRLSSSSSASSLSSSSSSLVYQLCRKASNLCVGGGGGGNFKVFLVLFILFLVSTDHLAQACGPGRGAGRRRAPRKLTPLVYKQHVPNFSENTLSASGFTEGRITRKDAKFKNLVPNYNQDIIFRDEEGTGADRLMTQRCKEKLNTLAISVMNQWPGVKLRVIEGWDEELHHATHSLHYEGRAVDITTSDKDRSKYGMLARLAVEAGFDWVYYESRAHIHCSVKSDSSQASRTGGCFTANSTVETPSGPRKMEEIKVGDKIRSIDDSGKEVFSDVLMFLDRNTSETREFYELTTESGAQLTLTPSHLLYSLKPEYLNPDDEFLLTKKNSYLNSEETAKYFLDQAEITFAKYVQLGDWLLVKSPHHKGDYTVEKVISIELREETGVYAPLTSTGNLVVDGVLTSCYALIQDQTLAHVAFAPVRLAHNFRQSVTYLWRQFSRFISFKSHALPHHSENSIDSEQDVKFNKPVSSSPSSWESRSSSSTNLIEDHLSNQGIHWYASFLYSTFRYVLPASLLYD